MLPTPNKPVVATEAPPHQRNARGRGVGGSQPGHSPAQPSSGQSHGASRSPRAGQLSSGSGGKDAPDRTARKAVCPRRRRRRNLNL